MTIKDKINLDLKEQGFTIGRMSRYIGKHRSNIKRTINNEHISLKTVLMIYHVIGVKPDFSDVDATPYLKELEVTKLNKTTRSK